VPLKSENLERFVVQKIRSFLKSFVGAKSQVPTPDRLQVKAPRQPHPSDACCSTKNLSPDKKHEVVLTSLLTEVGDLKPQQRLVIRGPEYADFIEVLNISHRQPSDQDQC
jgi:hypothetical protein